MTSERFLKTPTAPKPFLLIFPHIPKTGGTTLLYHFRKCLGDNHILSYGPHNRITRFFEDKHQLEELSDNEKNSLRVVQGHQVSQGLLSAFPKDNLRLLVVLRDPVGLTRSRFNHRMKASAERGIDVTAEQFLANDPPNTMSRILLEKFASFIDEDASNPLDQVFSILRKFDYVFTTERMDKQVKSLMDELGLPAAMERRRVADSKAELPVTDEYLKERNLLDLAVFTSVNHVLPVQTDRRHNPLGFDRAARARADAKALTNPQTAGGSSEHLYGELAEALCRSLRAEAAIEKTRLSLPLAIRDRDLFAQILEERWQLARARLTPAQVAISARWLDGWKANKQRKYNPA